MQRPAYPYASDQYIDHSTREISVRDLPRLVFVSDYPTALCSEVWSNLKEAGFESACIQALVELSKAIRGGCITVFDPSLAKEILDVLRNEDAINRIIQNWDESKISMLVTALVSWKPFFFYWC